MKQFLKYGGFVLSIIIAICGLILSIKRLNTETTDYLHLVPSLFITFFCLTLLIILLIFVLSFFKKDNRIQKTIYVFQIVFATLVLILFSLYIILTTAYNEGVSNIDNAIRWSFAINMLLLLTYNYVGILLINSADFVNALIMRKNEIENSKQDDLKKQIKELKEQVELKELQEQVNELKKKLEK